MNKQKNNLINKSIITVLTTVVVACLTVKTANAATSETCTTNYGGGETCTVTARFKIEKWVKLEGDNSWKDEVLIDLDDSDENDKKILFRVQVEADINNSSNVDLSSINFDDLKMKDSFPDELKYLDESDDELTEEWDDFKPGEKRTFYFTAKIESDERNRDGDFEKCVVNKASLYYQGDFQGSDDAVVCYKKTEEVLGAKTELPATGMVPVSGLLGLAVTALGAFLKLTKKS